MRSFLKFLAVVALLSGAVYVIFVLKPTPPAPIQLTKYTTTDTVMRLTVLGPVVLDQNYRSTVITIGRSQNEFKLFHTYTGNLINTQTYATNETAYADFLKALELKGFAKGNKDPKLVDDRGVCPFGKRYRYEIITGSEVVQRFYSTSCGRGTFRGKASDVRVLFHKQIPDYSKLARGL